MTDPAPSDQPTPDPAPTDAATRTDATAFDLERVAAPGETVHLRTQISETYLGDPVELPVTVIEGAEAGPTLLLTAALHGDELNGVKVCQSVAGRYDPAEIAGRIVCLHVVNVPGYLAQQRDIPIYDQDLNRSFPGRERANTAERIADRVYRRFVVPADLLIDLHTSTRNRTTMFHTRADLSDPAVERLDEAFGANLVLDGAGDPGSLRAVATANATPAVTVEMGKAHRFQRPLIERAVDGVDRVLAEYGLRAAPDPAEPAWRKRLGGDQERRWLRADQGGLVEMAWGPTPLVHEGEPICRVSDHFGTEETRVDAPFTGILVGVLENPVALPGHPLCHLARIDRETHAEIEAEIARGEFDGYRQLGLRWVDGAGDGDD